MKQKSTGKTQLNFTEIKAGQYCGLEERTELVINNSADWEKLWNQVYSIYHPMPALPQIDFSNFTIICLSTGNKSTGGYSVEILEIYESTEKIEVFYKTGSPGPDDYVTMALSHPYHLVLIPKTDKEVNFRTFHPEQK